MPSLRDLATKAPGWFALVWTVVGFLGGYALIPHTRIQRLEAQQAAQRRDLDELRVINVALARLACLQATPEQRSLLGLPCHDLLANRFPGAP